MPTVCAANGRTKRRSATQTRRSRRRGAARPAGPGSLPRCFTRIRSSADAAEGPSRWWPTSPIRGDPADPGTPRPQPARKAASRHPRRPPHAGGRRGPRDRGPARLSGWAPPRLHPTRGVVSAARTSPRSHSPPRHKKTALSSRGHPPTPGAGVGGKPNPLADRPRLRRPHRGRQLRSARRFLLAGRDLGQTEIQDLHPSRLGHHHVGRLEVAMDDALLVVDLARSAGADRSGVR